MDDIDKIHIKLELCKDKGSGLTIITHFNTNAPNFIKEGEGFYWMPTSKERAFLNDAFNLISTDKNGNPEEKNILKFQNKKNSQEKIDETKQESTELPDLEKIKENENPFEETIENEDIYKNEKTTITELDIQEIDETLERYREKEGSISKNDKEKIIEKILKHKKK